MALLSGPQTTTTSMSTPDYLRPYYDRAISRGESAFTEPYKPYTGNLTAGLAPVETQGINSAASLQLPGQFQSAGNLMNAAGTGIMSLAGFQPNQTTGGVFDATQAQQYMSPFQQNVTDIQRREAQRDFDKQQTALRARAGMAGAFGGSRATLLETENQRNQNQLLDDIQAKGSQSAFLNAQDQFERDRLARLSAFDKNEQARQAAAGIGIRSLEGAANIGQGLGQLGTQIGSESRANISTQLGAGLQQREQQQMDLNNQYQQFLEERGYPREQAANFAKLLAGLGQGQGVETKTGPEVGSLAQIIGLLSQGTGILGTIGGKGGAGAGLDLVKGGITSLFGGGSGANAAIGNLFPATQGVYTGGLDDADFDLFGSSGGFDIGGFLSGIGTDISSGVSGFLNNFFPS